MSHITIEWHGDNFNVNLHSQEGRDAFLSIKGCRIVDGSKGQFVSYPAKKQDGGKYWNHVWGSEQFNSVVLSKANESRPKQERAARPTRGGGGDDDSSIPF